MTKFEQLLNEMCPDGCEYKKLGDVTFWNKHFQNLSIPQTSTNKYKSISSKLLKDINVSATFIGIILAILDIVQGKSAVKANKFNEKHSNKSLTYISLRMAIGIAIAGAVVVIGMYRIPMLAIIIFTYILRMSDKGIYKIISKRYMGNFMTPDILTKIYSVNSVIASIFRMFIGAVRFIFTYNHGNTICYGNSGNRI